MVLPPSESSQPSSKSSATSGSIATLSSVANDSLFPTVSSANLSGNSNGKMMSEVEHKQALNVLEQRLRGEFAQSTVALEETLRKSHAADTRALRDQHAAQVRKRSIFYKCLLN